VTQQEDRRDQLPPSGMPPWVKAVAVVAAVVVLLLVIARVTGLAAGHGPGRHSSLGGATAATTADVPAETGRGR
jgi:hypothetical protein